MRKVRQGDASIAVAYLRVSTDEQNNGIAAQRAAIDAFRDRHGLTVSAYVVDIGVSGGAELGIRPGWYEAMRAITTHGAGILLVHKRDRIARDVALAVDATRAVTSRGARLQSADGLANGTDPADAMLRTLLDAFAAQERAIIGSRTTAALAAKRARGEAISPPRYGWKRDGALEIPCEREQAAVKAAREARKQGVPFRRLGTLLAAMGHVGRTGRPFCLSALHEMTRGP